MKKDQNNKIDDLMKLALFNKAQGNFSSAIELLEKILTLDPKNKKALNNRGNIYKDMRKFVDAIKSYSYAINIDSNYQIAKINLAILHHDLGNFNGDSSNPNIRVQNFIVDITAVNNPPNITFSNTDFELVPATTCHPE